jgi:hypothetical protein
MKAAHLLVNLLRWYVDGLRQPTLNAVARLILIWSFTALAAISASINIKTEWLNITLLSGSNSTYFFMFLVFCSLVILAYTEHRDRKIASDSLLIKVRHMGLVDHKIDDVENYFPSSLKKIKPQALNIEFENSHKTSDLDALNKQLLKIERIPDAIKDSASSLNNSKKHIVYSGVAPVPMIAAAGHAISNMQNVYVADWNRQKRKWHFSTDLDDGATITIETVIFSNSESSVNIIISLSLPIDVNKVLINFKKSNYYHINWEDKNPSYDRLSSTEKQERIVGEILTFINGVILPTNPHIKEVNIFVAAQASFVFRLGAALNQGHLPKTTFYHFNPDNPKSLHPWGVAFNGGIDGYQLITKES